MPTPEAQQRGMTCLDGRESPAVPSLKSSCLRFTGSQPSKRADASFPQPGCQASRAAGWFSHSAQLSVNSGSQFKWGIVRRWGRGRRKREGRVAGLVAPQSEKDAGFVKVNLTKVSQKPKLPNGAVQLHYKATYQWPTEDFEYTFLQKLSEPQMYSRDNPVDAENSPIST